MNLLSTGNLAKKMFILPPRDPMYYCFKFCFSSTIKYIINGLHRNGNFDFWWSSKTKHILPSSISSDFNCELMMGKDILDIWFDSGTSWYCSHKPTKTADLILEGVDQFTGWFQSSLLTSIAMSNSSPFK